MTNHGILFEKTLPDGRYVLVMALTFGRARIKQGKGMSSDADY